LRHIYVNRYWPTRTLCMVYCSCIGLPLSHASAVYIYIYDPGCSLVCDTSKHLTTLCTTDTKLDRQVRATPYSTASVSGGIAPLNHSWVGTCPYCSPGYRASVSLSLSLSLCVCVCVCVVFACFMGP